MSRPIYYRPIERHWYRIADFVQHTWHRFEMTRTYRAVLWLLPRLLVVVFRLVMMLARAVVIVGGLTLFIFLSFAFSNKKR